MIPHGSEKLLDSRHQHIDYWTYAICSTRISALTLRACYGISHEEMNYENPKM